MITGSESWKREKWLTLGRFRLPIFCHSFLLAVQREHCHSQLRDSVIYLIKEAAAREALSGQAEAADNVQVVTNRDGR